MPAARITGDQGDKRVQGVPLIWEFVSPGLEGLSLLARAMSRTLSRVADACASSESASTCRQQTRQLALDWSSRVQNSGFSRRLRQQRVGLQLRMCRAQGSKPAV